ncbi:MAG TPA: GNAT family N-acetyltransferase [Bryobacteraceae bacterium]|nr:GNAT family N-acetyltransferase [Bryobacteraceae bacterium]
MAARLHPAMPVQLPEVIDLRRISARDLVPLLEEEIRAWREELEWDFEKSAELVRRFVDVRALSGSALVDGGKVLGYAYYVLEENKGLIGDLFVTRDASGVEWENRLLDAALAEIMANPATTRIESQLMMLHPAILRNTPFSEHLTAHDRNFMRIDLRSAQFPESRVRHPIYIEKWDDHYLDAAAELISSAYSGHIDSRINDQYRTAAGARRFLFNIVQFPGCGAFFRAASYVALDALTGRLCGISLASLVAPDCGHVTQICVSPAVRNTGVGYALLRQSLTGLQSMGCRSASLTVTAANEDAVALYKRVGFHTLRRFSAWVWEDFQTCSH